MPDRHAYPTLNEMGESALIVSFGNRVSASLRTRVYGLYSTLSELEIPGVTDLVPAYASLLIRFNPLSLPVEALGEVILPLLTKGSPKDPPNAAHHLIPVRYGGEDGPDLRAVAGMHGLSEAEAIRLHSQQIYSVYFLGFLPGFAYMGRVTRQIATPRLATPRVQVPAGSVGIANAQTAIYPFSSPGGWRLIGRTDVAVWDPHAPSPALFAPGDTVEFTPSDSVSGPRATTGPTLAVKNPVFRVHEPGALTTIQDLGRPGLAHLGLSMGGACDRQAALQANAVVGNPPGAALMEMTWTGPTLDALQPITIALEGADFGCRIDGNLVPPGISWFVRGGSIIKFVRPHSSGGGARAYLAVSGGLEAARVLGSRSTCLPASFGGYEGRPLRAGDLLGVQLPPHGPAYLAGRSWVSRPDLALNGEAMLRFVPYGGVGRAGARATRKLASIEWQVTPQSDRIGLRLAAVEGGHIQTGGKEYASFGVVRGAIQLPPGGQPVVLNVDHQTTGGYPLIGVVAQADWPMLSQLRPGDVVRFVEISREEALAALASERNSLLQGLSKMGLKLGESDYALV
jgi:KipI family sensor histidine kinase inhibitor